VSQLYNLNLLTEQIRCDRDFFVNDYKLTPKRPFYEYKYDRDF